MLNKLFKTINGIFNNKKDMAKKKKKKLIHSNFENF